MTIDPVELEQLSKAATQGVWEHEFRGGHTSQGEVTCGEHSVITVNGGNFAQWRDAPDDGEAEFKANGDFVCALVNAYRTGQLVPAQPSGDVVEAVARAIRRSEIGNFSDETRAQAVVDGSWEHRIQEATAAITAYEAVSGVAKMREALREIGELTERRQLPLTNQINDIVLNALRAKENGDG